MNNNTISNRLRLIDAFISLSRDVTFGARGGTDPRFAYTRVWASGADPSRPDESDITLLANGDITISSDIVPELQERGVAVLPRPNADSLPSFGRNAWYVPYEHVASHLPDGSTTVDLKTLQLILTTSARRVGALVRHADWTPVSDDVIVHSI